MGIFAKQASKRRSLISRYLFIISVSGVAVFGPLSDAAGSPIVIDTVDELQNIQSDLSGDYVLGNNIDASATGAWNDGAGFQPIGNSSTPFTGTFSGNGYSISDLTIDAPSATDVGLFGVTGTNAILQNVTITNGNVTGLNDVGDLVGLNNGSVKLSSATGSATGSVIASGGPVSAYTGGLVGYNAGTISDSRASTAVSSSASVGGLVGINAGTVLRSSASGPVSGANDGVGGLVGANVGTIGQSYATGNVAGAVYDTGGLVGSNGDSGIVRDSYATGSVSNPYWYNTGGLIGGNTGTVSTSYATGAVTGCCDVGGLIGLTQRAGTTTNSYWDVNTTGLSVSDGGTGLTTAQLSSGTLPAGFSPAVWVTTPGKYPTLQWQGTPTMSSVLDGSVHAYFPDGPTGGNWSYFVGITHINTFYPASYLAEFKKLHYPASQYDFSVGVGATFTPNGGVSLADAAALIHDPRFPSGFTHFNWLQLYYVGSTLPTLPSQYTTLDPPDTGCSDTLAYVNSDGNYNCQGSKADNAPPSPVPIRNADLLPWYLDERFTVNGQQIYTDDGTPIPGSNGETRAQQWKLNSNTLLFNDNPSPRDDGQSIYFITCLAAVDASGAGDTIFDITGNNQLKTCFRWQASPITSDTDAFASTDGIVGTIDDNLIFDGPISTEGWTPSDFEALAGGGDYLIVSAAPEPSSYLLLGSGILCLLGTILLTRRRRI